MNYTIVRIICILFGCIAGIVRIYWVVNTTQPQNLNDANFEGSNKFTFEQQRNNDFKQHRDNDFKQKPTSQQSGQKDEAKKKDREQRKKEARMRRSKKKEEEDIFVRETVESAESESFPNYYDELRKAKEEEEEEEERKARRDSSFGFFSEEQCEEPDLDEDLRPDDWSDSETAEESNGTSQKETEAEFLERKRYFNREWEQQKYKHLKRSYYKVLDLNRDSTLPDVKKAFRLASGKNHPDRGGDVGAQTEINRAYEVLGDTRLRKSYNFFLIQNKIRY